MSITEVQTFNNQSLQNIRDAYNKAQISGSSSKKNGTAAQLNNNGASPSDNLITRNERDFFIGMFPANSEQIEKHVVFNRNGHIQSQNLSKGIFIDGKA